MTLVTRPRFKNGPEVSADLRGIRPKSGPRAYFASTLWLLAALLSTVLSVLETASDQRKQRRLVSRAWWSRLSESNR